MVAETGAVFATPGVKRLLRQGENLKKVDVGKDERRELLAASNQKPKSPVALKPNADEERAIESSRKLHEEISIASLQTPGLTQPATPPSEAAIATSRALHEEISIASQQKQAPAEADRFNWPYRGFAGRQKGLAERIIDAIPLLKFFTPPKEN